jgi:precorrin-6B methylase 2
MLMSTDEEEAAQDLENLIEELSGGFRTSQVLLTANRLNLFDYLGESERSLDELALLMKTDPRATRILCNALVGLSILERTKRGYRNSPAALQHLLKESPKSKTAMLKHSAKLYERWSHLHETMKTGTPVPNEILDSSLLGGKEEFAEAMADSARTSAGVTAEILDLSWAQTLLDVGGGPGIFSIAFCRKNAQLQAIVLDDAETLRVTSHNIQQAGLQDRISIRSGDAFRDDLGSSFDFIFVSNLIHIYSSEENQKLVTRCAAALKAGGCLGLKDFFLENDYSGPQWSLLFAVNMLVGTERGDCYTLGEAKKWFEQAGLTFERRYDLTKSSRLLLARKSEGEMT